MPANNGTPRVWYAILDDLKGLNFKIDALDYDFKTASCLIQNKPLPQTYKQTLKTSIWYNCEILPEQEVKLRRKKIEF